MTTKEDHAAQVATIKAATEAATKDHSSSIEAWNRAAAMRDLTKLLKEIEKISV